MNAVYTVLLLLCTHDIRNCNKDNASNMIAGHFVNSGESKNPCEDWLLAQLEYNALIKRDLRGMSHYFECSLKEE